MDYSKTTSKVTKKVFQTCREDLFVHQFNRQMMTHRCTQWVLVSSTCPFGCWSVEGRERLCEINGERQSWSMRQRQKGCGQSVLCQEGSNLIFFPSKLEFLLWRPLKYGFEGEESDRNVKIEQK